MSRQQRQQLARYNTNPQQPRGLSRQHIEPLLQSHNGSAVNRTRRFKKTFTKPVDDLKVDTSSDIEREPEDSESENSDDHDINGAIGGGPSSDALQVRKYNDELASQSAKKRKLEDEEDQRITQWSQTSSQRKNKSRYGGYQAARLGSSGVKAAESETPKFTNIHATKKDGISNKKKIAGNNHTLPKPPAPEVTIETNVQKKGSKFKRPQSLLPSSHPSATDEAENLENEDPKDKMARKPRRSLNVPKVIKDLAANNDLENLAHDITSKRTMRLPHMPNNAATSLQSPASANEVLEGSTAGSVRSRAQSVAGSDSSMSEIEEIDNPDPQVIVEKVQCPICSARLLKQVWNDWARKHPHMSLRDKQRFCANHTMRDAREAWSRREYPQIEWGEAFKQRLESYRDFVDDLLQNPGQSFFRTHFKDAVDRGESRTVQKRGGEAHRSNVGYYGLKGLEIISAFISYEYAAELRALAVTDAMIAARDQSGYINLVLVPEMVSRLIMDDMDVDVERAREIMEESHALGDLLCGTDASTQRS